MKIRFSLLRSVSLTIFKGYNWVSTGDLISESFSLLLKSPKKSAKSLSWATSLLVDSAQDSFWQLFWKIWAKVKKKSEIKSPLIRYDICKRSWKSQTKTKHLSKISSIYAFLLFCDILELDFLHHFWSSSRVVKNKG